MGNDLLVDTDAETLTVTFNRPEQRNAMTWEMYEGLTAACRRAHEDQSIRLLILRGAGGQAFVAGTDIAQFRGFTGSDGVAYERRISAVLDEVANVGVPVIAAIDGYCIGGGLGIAAQADLRIADASAMLGIPIARTLGNCLSSRTLNGLVGLIGRSRASDLLLTGRLVAADEAARMGLVNEVTDDVDTALDRTTRRILSGAPLTQWATKESLHRLTAGNIDDEDIIDRVYGSADFASAVDAFLTKQKPTWTGT